MHKFKSFSVLEIQYNFLSCRLLRLRTAYSQVTQMTSLIHNYLHLLPLSGILHFTLAPCQFFSKQRISNSKPFWQSFC